MKKFFSIGEAAKAVHTTSETLRHYDRIGLVKPSATNKSTKYRYYTQQDLVRLNTVRALQLMDLPLHEIKEVLEYDDLEKVVEFLDRAEKKADEKLKALQYSKSKIQLAKADYERKLREQQKLKFSGAFLKDLPERIILLSDTLEVPTLDNLWSYLSHFYNKVGPALKDHFSFEDQAGIYSEPGLTRLFAVCTRYPEIEGLKRLPGGRYLCADCTEENRAQILEKLTRTARTKYHTDPAFTVQLIVVSVILQWDYEIQIYIGK